MVRITVWEKKKVTEHVSETVFQCRMLGWKWSWMLKLKAFAGCL